MAVAAVPAAAAAAIRSHFLPFLPFFRSFLFPLPRLSAYADAAVIINYRPM